MFATQAGGTLILSGLPVLEQVLSLGPGTGSQEWSDSARGAAARGLLAEP